MEMKMMKKLTKRRKMSQKKRKRRTMMKMPLRVSRQKNIN
jgi:hypothetical protein